MTKIPKLYVGAMNDAVFIIDKRPVPAPIDYVNPEWGNELGVEIPCGQNYALAQKLVHAWNSTLLEHHIPPREIKECPFCGTVPHPNHVHIGGNPDDGLSAFTYCFSCGTHGPWAPIPEDRVGFLIHPTETEKASAHKLWNERWRDLGEAKEQGGIK